MIPYFTQLALAICLFIMPAFAADNKSDPRTHYVLVSVPAHKFFVEKIAGDTAKVINMVPPGASSHTFEPTPKQMLIASKADIWFRIGEGFEPRAVAALQSHNPRMQLVDLREGLDLITDSHGHVHCCCHESCQDLHIWLSPKMAKIQAGTIANALIALYPENKEKYETSLSTFKRELDALDQEIASELAPLKNRTIMVSHPAYAYLARDYNLKQLSIEFEGKDPTPQQLTKVLNQARSEHITKVFIQMQYNSKGARLIAKEIGAEVVNLDPYSENYYESLRQIAHSFASQ